jgi:Leucine-rich repeat (LRR) protein
MCLFLLSFLCLLPALSQDPETPVSFNDAALAEAMASARWLEPDEALFFPVDANGDGVITYGEARAVTGDLDLSGKQIRDAGGIEAFINVTRLFFLRNELSALPDLSALTSLYQLNISQNQFSSLVVENIPRLGVLQAVGNQIMDVSLANLPALHSLDLSGNRLTTLENLPDLQVLLVSNNQLTQLPDLGNRLLILGARGNQLTELPPLPQVLRNLTLDQNRLTAFPDLPASLIELSARSNRLSTLPAMDHLEKLRVLDLEDNQLTLVETFPPNPETINLDRNQLVELPPIDSDTTRLLLARNNRLTEMPEIIGSGELQLQVSGNLISGDLDLSGLPGLIDLNLNRNRVDSISGFPPNLERFLCDNNNLQAIAELPQTLDSLSVSRNQLRALPTIPARVRILSAEHNEIIAFPQFAPRETAINLDLEENLIQSLPDVLPDHFFALKIGENAIATMPDLSANTALEVLDISNNSLNELSGLPSSLRILRAQGNNITTADLSSLHVLIELNLSHNQISIFPNISWLGNLDFIFLAHNPLTDITRLIEYFQFTEQLPRLVDISYNDLGFEWCIPIEEVRRRPDFDVAFIVDPGADGSSLPCDDLDENIFFEDPIMGLLLSTYVRNGTVIDTNGDDKVSFREALAVNHIEIEGGAGPLGSFQDLRHFKNLRTLIIKRGFEATTLTVLEQLPKLEHLSLRSGRISFISGFTPSLRWIDLGHNRLTQLPPLPPNLRYLDVVVNRLESLPPLPDSVFSLKVSANQLQELPELPLSLRFLFCHSNQLTELPPLAQPLAWIYAWNNQLSRLPELPATLTTLSVFGNKIDTLPELPLGISDLDLSRNPLGFFPPLQPYANLHTLKVAQTGLSILPQPPRSLRYLDCSDNQIQSLPPLDHAPVQVIRASHNQIKELPNIASLPALEIVDLSHNQLSTAAAIAANPWIGSLPADLVDISYNNIDAGDCPNIQTLYDRGLFSFRFHPQRNGTTPGCIDGGESIAFTDPAFRHALVFGDGKPVSERKHDTPIDVNGDGEIGMLEAERVTRVDTPGTPNRPGFIQFLDGIEHFTNLEFLDASHESIEALPDFSNNTALTQSLLLNNNQLTDVTPLLTLPLESLDSVFVIDVLENLLTEDDCPQINQIKENHYVSLRFYQQQNEQFFCN